MDNEQDLYLRIYWAIQFSGESMQNRQMYLALIFVIGLPVFAIGKESTSQRAKPPQWPREVREVFFDDARQHLVGNRPDFSSATKQMAVKAAVTSEGTESAWSDLIDEDTLTTEVKRVTNQVARTTLRAGAFKSEGHRLCERDFGLLTIWFGVVDEFDMQVRWQRDASAVQAYLLSAAKKCAEGSEESFAVAQEANEILAELMRGQSPSLPPTGERAPPEDGPSLDTLMHRMKQASEEKLATAVAGKKEFRKGRYEVLHEAQILAVLARVVRQAGFEYSDDETYLEYAQQLEKAAVELTQAARDGDFEAAERANGQLNQSCVGCHEDFRG